MAITERQVIGQRAVLPDGQIQVRTDTIIDRDGVEIARSYHRRVVVPGDDLAAMPPEVRRLAQVEHTPAVVAAYRAVHPS